MSNTRIFYIKSTINGSGLYLRKTFYQLAIWISGKLYPTSKSIAILFKYYSVGVPKILMISISCSMALSPGKIGYFVRNYAKIHPADQTSIDVSYKVYLNKSYGER